MADEDGVDLLGPRNTRKIRKKEGPSLLVLSDCAEKPLFLAQVNNL